VLPLWLSSTPRNLRTEPCLSELHCHCIFCATPPHTCCADLAVDYSPETKSLYVYYNGTGVPPSDGEFVATSLQTLVSFEGSLENPIKGVTLSGLHFRDAAQSFMEPHGVPSCGDWALQRAAGIFIEGTEDTLVNNCTFTRMDGNGLMLSRYNRRAIVSNSEFAWIGDTAMAAWGYTDELSDNGIHGFNATAGELDYSSLLAACDRAVDIHVAACVPI